MPNSDEFSKLFEPGYIGRMKIKNRIVMPPMATNYATEDGHVTDLMIHHYEQRAKGGVGLIVVEGTGIDYPGCKGWINEAGIDDDKYIPGLKRLVDAVHREDAKVALQLHHGGREAKQKVAGQQPVAPSPIPAPGGDAPRELTAAEIETLVDKFAQAAARAKECGFDGVEIHGAHGYLLAEFISSASNKRQDQYGGELANRARFLLEVIRAIRSAVGDDFPVWCRLNGEERGVEGGVTLEETKKVAQMAQDAGCDALHISTYGYGGQATVTFPDKPGGLLPLAEGVKGVVSIPVIAVGSMTPEVAEKALEEGRVDFIAMGRELLCDAELPNKLLKGTLEDIVPCIHCFNCLDKIVVQSKTADCSVNPALGRGPEYGITLVQKPKRVLVAGGGPAGLEVARVAALRGHEVTLYDEGERLGGQMLLACLPPNKERIGDYIDYLTVQMDELDVEVEMGEPVTTDIVKQLNPDALVVATGMSPAFPEIPGLDKMSPVFAHQVLSDECEVGDSVIMIGGGVVGCETADFLAERGKKVTIIEILPRIAANMILLRRAALLSRLRAKGVVMLSNAHCEEATKAGIVVRTKEGQRETLSAETVVIAAGGRPNNGLYRAFQDKITQTYLIGDAVEPRTILEAVAEGYHIGITL
jgi:2,4-dienoyl-CoA reductase-like NADH-dependent reductase (Old Yellow Enzyme family)/thioredoxin reductase